MFCCYGLDQAVQGEDILVVHQVVVVVAVVVEVGKMEAVVVATAAYRIVQIHKFSLSNQKFDWVDPIHKVDIVVPIGPRVEKDKLSIRILSIIIKKVHGILSHTL